MASRGTVARWSAAEWFVLSIPVALLGMVCWIALFGRPDAWNGAGTVIDRDHDSAITVFVGSSPIVIPETWWLDVRDASGRVHKRVVDGATFEHCQIGSHYVKEACFG